MSTHPKDPPIASEAEAALTKARAFAAALNAKDEEAARAACAPGAWEASGDSPGRLARRVSKYEAHITVTPVVIVAEGRAAVEALWQAPRDRSDTFELLVERDAGGWSVAGVGGDHATTRAFLAGLTGATTRFEDLPPSPRGQRWIEQVLRALRAGHSASEAIGDVGNEIAATAAAGFLASALEMAEEDEHEPVALVARELSAAERVGCGLRVGDPDFGEEIWFVMEPAEIGLRLIAPVAHISLASLLAGVEALDAVALEPVVYLNSTETDAFMEALRRALGPGDAPADPKRLAEALSAALSEAWRSRGAPDVEQLMARLQERVARYLDSNGLRGEGRPALTWELLAEHGPALLTEVAADLLRAIAEQAAPT